MNRTAATTMQQVSANGGDEEVEMTVMAVETAHVGCARLSDGMVVQLAGDLTVEELPLLRQVLLTPMPSDCHDVVVDAGGVGYVDDAALAVLVAAREWIEDQGVRFLMSCTSVAFDEALEAHGCAGGLPRLAELPGPVADTVPWPSSAT